MFKRGRAPNDVNMFIIERVRYKIQNCMRLFDDFDMTIWPKDVFNYFVLEDPIAKLIKAFLAPGLCLRVIERMIRMINETVNFANSLEFGGQSRASNLLGHKRETVQV